jgi:transposase-like protein
MWIVQFGNDMSAIVHTLPGDFGEARRWFTTPENCVSLIATRRWKNGEVLCPVCGLAGAGYVATRGLWECKGSHPRKQFSVRAGTLFEESHVSLEQWLTAIWILANSRRKVSSYQLARELGITQKSAWFLLLRIRTAVRVARRRMQVQIGLRRVSGSL